jgi:hypothetical protein
VGSTAGVGTAIAGFRTDGAIIDDPIRSREDADPQHVRDKIWDWYKSDLLTRLAPGGWVTLIQTRWHEDDLAGRIIAEMERGGERWDIVSLPAEAEAGDLLGREPGQWLWDDAYGYGERLREEKATQLPRNWSALYQQRPAPDTGDYFKAEWFRTYTRDPPRETLNIYGRSDYAVTRMAATIRCTSLSASTQKTACICSISGGVRYDAAYIKAGRKMKT